LVPDTTTWHDLPDEMVLSIFYQCPLRDAIALGCVDRRTHALSRDQGLWRHLYEGITLRPRDADEGALTSSLEEDASTIKAFDEAVSSLRQWIAQACSPLHQAIDKTYAVPERAPRDQAASSPSTRPLDAANEAAAVAAARSHLHHDFDVEDWRWACAAALYSLTTFASYDGVTSKRVGNLSSESLALRLIRACKLDWDITSRLLREEPPPVLRYAGDLDERGEPHGRGTANLYSRDSEDRMERVVMRVSGEWSDGLPHGHVRWWFAPPASLRYYEGACKAGYPIHKQGVVALFRNSAYAQTEGEGENARTIAFRTPLYAGTRPIGAKGDLEGVVVRRDGTRFFSGRVSLLGEPLEGTFCDRGGVPVYKGRYGSLSDNPTFETEFEIYGHHGTIMRPADFNATDDEDYEDDDDALLHMDPVWIIFPNGDRARCLIDIENTLPDTLVVRSFTFSALAEGKLAGLTIDDRHSWRVAQPQAPDTEEETVQACATATHAKERDGVLPDVRVLVLDDDAAEEDCFSSSFWKIRQTTALTFRPRGHRLESAFCEHMARHYGPRWAMPAPSSNT
jgi:hypothetical protein